MSHISPRKIKDFSPNFWRGNFLYTDCFCIFCFQTVRLRKIYLPENWFEKLVFYAMYYP